MTSATDFPAIAPTPDPAPLASAEAVRTPWSEFWRKFKRQKVALVAAGSSCCCSC